MQRNDDLDELYEAPLLRGLPKHDPFMVPDGFFDRLPHRVQERIVARPAHRGTDRLAAWTFPRLAWSGLAVLALIAVMWVLWPAPRPVEGPSLSFAVEPADLIDLEADEDLLYAVVGSEQPMLDVRQLPLDEGELAAYIEHEEMPLDLLIEEL